MKGVEVVRVMMEGGGYENEIIGEEIGVKIVYEEDEVMVMKKGGGVVVEGGCGN